MGSFAIFGLLVIKCR